MKDPMLILIVPHHDRAYATGALESDLHQHIHLENNVLFPRVQVMALQEA